MNEYKRTEKLVLGIHSYTKITITEITDYSIGVSNVDKKFEESAKILVDIFDRLVSPSFFEFFLKELSKSSEYHSEILNSFKISNDKNKLNKILEIINNER